jgi:phosphoadenosine phosphosulfate reductase
VDGRTDGEGDLSVVNAQLDLPALNAEFASKPASVIVEWSIREFGDDVVVSSSFGAESAVMIHLAIQHNPRIRIIMVDTGYLFPETFGHLEALRKRFDLNVWVYRTKNDPIAWLREAGEGDPAWRGDVARCCAANKNEPFERAMKELAPRAWLRGIRGQTDNRRTANYIDWFARYNCYAVSPILKWTTKDIWQYMKQHDLPYHPLFEKGYKSIGCNPLSCTRAITGDEDERAGRWSGKDKDECGINLSSLDSSQL